jgi:aminoglycoside phosphotransferase family enzyme/predicted kinase
MDATNMDTLQPFQALCQAMADPSFYPHTVFLLERRDTHISSVFLTGRWVYKLKKPVNFGFLDFRDMANRHRFCEREVSLNRRLTQGVYQEVTKIYQSDDGRFSLEENGRVVEYAVKMRQLPDAVSLRELLKKNKIGPMHMEKLGQTLAAFYERSNRSSQIDYYGRRDVIAFNMEENFRQLEPFVSDILEHERWEFICQVSRSFLENRQGLFDRRVETGRIRDGHGDLRADHVYFYRGLQIIDCIEFNDRFRCGDAVVDLAFLHMDLEHLGHLEWSLAFLAAYVNHANDPELYALLDFYAAYRAIVRLKVSCLGLKEAEIGKREFLKDEARRYMDQAYQYAIQFSRPTLWIFCGLPATGKSSLAAQVSKALSISVFRSDRIRKEKQAHAHEQVVPFGHGLYRPGMRHRVYAQLLALAQETLRGGDSVILDATFAYRKWRDEARLLATDLDTNLIFVQCLCKEETMRSRLGQRRTTSSLSDARIEHFPEMLADFDPIAELSPEIHLSINTDQPLSDICARVLSEGYAHKCYQVKKLL